MSAGSVDEAVAKTLSSVSAHPADALKQGRRVLEQTDDPRLRSIVLRALADAARDVETLSSSVRYAEEAVEAAVVAGDEKLRSEALMTLAGSFALSGDNGGALAAIEEARRGAEEYLAAQLWFQEGSVLARMGETGLAFRAFAMAQPVLEAASDDRFLAMLFNNRGLMSLASGDLGAARLDLEESRRLCVAMGDEFDVATIDHTLARLHAIEGDIPTALAMFSDSEDRIRRMVGTAAEIQVSHVQTLLSVGLAREALSMVETMAGEMRAAGLEEDLAEAVLEGARAALIAGDPEQAVRLAAEAGDLFQRQDRAVWAANAKRVELAADLVLGRASHLRHRQARRAAELLAVERQSLPAADARLTAALLAVELGDLSAAAADLDQLARVSSGPVELMLDVWYARALLGHLKGNRVAAFSAARAGLDLVARSQAALGASDLRVAVDARSARLGQLAVELAFESRRPRHVFNWLERTRANTLHLRPTKPPEDTTQAEELALLRSVSADLRTAVGEEAARLETLEKRLQDAVRTRDRTVHGEGDVLRKGDVAHEVAAALGGSVLIELGQVNGRVVAVVARNGRFTLHAAGDAAAVRRESESLRFTLRRMARGLGRPQQVKQVAARVDEILLHGVPTGSGPVVIVPTPELYGTPWSALPSLKDRPITVAPSASAWLDRSRAQPRDGDVVVVGGPDLEEAEKEVLEISAVHRSKHAFVPGQAGVADVTRAIDGAGLAHIAAHAFFQFENPMFSSLRLADGDLNVYDIERLNSPPQLVVLSACDSGFTDTHPGEELLGLTSALLAMGTRTVVSSIGLVPDAAATRILMSRFHQELARGSPPAHALHVARGEVDDSPEGLVAAASFVCVGGG